MANFTNNPKDMPKVIGLGVAVAGLLGYAAFGFISGGGAKEHPTVHPNTDTARVALARNQEKAGNEDPAGAAEAPQANVPGLSLPTTFNPDPFHSPVRPKLDKESLRPPSGGAKGDASLAGMKPGPRLPSVGGPSGVAGTVVAAPPPAPEPPVVVTGTSLCQGADTAILEVGTEHRVVQVGDPVFGDYRVKRILMDGVVLGSKKNPHRFFGKGARTRVAKSQATDLPAGTGAPGTEPQLGTLAVQPQTH